MNPIPLKPEADSRSQVVVLGRPWATLPAGSYYRRKAELWQVVVAALERLRARADLVIIEGAGSPAELNLKQGDIVNMAVARHARSPVVLVGDIDKGGIFAQLLGTLWLLAPEEQTLVRGLIVNKFRGDPALFEDGVRILEERGGVPVLGVVPWLPDHGIAEEDAASLDELPRRVTRPDNGVIDIAVIAFPRIANFDDVDPLTMEPGVRVRFVRSPAALGRPQAVILPGTKHTLADLAWLRQVGLADAILAEVRRGMSLVGICGGYQMLGRVVRDPDGVEGGGEAKGLGLLPTEVTFRRDKTTWQVRARLCGALPWAEAETELCGYEIHMGHAATPAPLLMIYRPTGEVVPDGAATDDGRVWGTHLHGLFFNDAFREAWLRSLGWQPPSSVRSALARRMDAYDRWADVLEASLDIGRLDAIIGW